MKFHENFKRIANEKGTTPTAVVRDLGLSTSKVASWNRGGLPKQDTLAKLAQYLGCSVVDFFWDENDEKKVAFEDNQIQAEPENDDEEDILRIYRSLGRREKHEFMSMVYEYERAQKLLGDETAAQ